MSAVDVPAPTQWQRAAARQEYRPVKAELRRRIGEAQGRIAAAEVDRAMLLKDRLLKPMTEQEAAHLDEAIAEVEAEITAARLTVERAEVVQAHLA